jgi:uncharacterized protein (UPF0248 family)
MIPIRELLDRIRWDPEFAKSEFAIGYYDRRLISSKLDPGELHELCSNAKNRTANR